MLRAPYPWLGGKRKVASIVWTAFGNPNSYVEPFFGSGAVLLGRPNGPGKIETANDIDGGICNFWRAIQNAPDEVAKWCDWPVSELDLHARHTWLIERLATLTDDLRADPHAFDAQVAGYWVWGISQWIGTGWCGGVKRGKPRPNLNSGQGVHALGVRMPSIGNDRGIFGVAAPPAQEWFRSLSQRLRRVRVCCGEWTRVVSDAALGRGLNVGGRAPVGVFLDPPYDTELRGKRIYNNDPDGLAKQVRDWAIEHGDDPDLRVALCGYAGEHEMPANWTAHAWKGARGYAATTNTNRERERIWFSPHCLPLQDQVRLFDRIDRQAEKATT